MRAINGIGARPSRVSILACPKAPWQSYRSNDMPRKAGSATVATLLLCLAVMTIASVTSTALAQEKSRPQQKWRNLSLFIGYHGILRNLIVTMHKFTHLS